MERNGKEVFVWVKGLKGPAPAIWHTGQATRDMVPITPLQKHPMTDNDMRLTLDQLAVKYPFEGQGPPTRPRPFPAALEVPLNSLPDAKAS